ncbi:MAG TPA: HD domain-containing phosphohydrolase [Anaerolineales bacterium]
MSGEKILVVEDNDITRQGLKTVLEADGYQLLCAADGLDALEQMKSETPDLILSDISMPRMDGYAFFEAVRFRAEWVSIPFVFLTARGGDADIRRGKELGAEDYLVKPVDRQELTTAIRSRLERNRQLRLAQMQQAYQASLIKFSNAIEMRNHSTPGRAERVLCITLAIARKLGLDCANQMNSLELGSILHDIGKIQIREQVLIKPGPLDPDEWVEVKRHPEMGANLVKTIDYLAPAIPVILHHHERWDGTGYPDGLAGEAIPLEARIVAVADALDAMTASRVFAESYSPEQAYAEIVKDSGLRYDPRVIDAFRYSWNEIRSRL